MKTVTLLLIVFLSTSLEAISQNSHYAGKFTAKGSKIFGGWRIVDDGDKHWIHFNKNFKVTGADEVDVYLSPNLLKDLGEEDVLDSAILVVNLEKNFGEQEHPIPDGTDLEDFDTILVIDRATGRLLGGAQIHAAKIED